MHEDPRPIYLDHHATTPLDPRVLEAMLPFLGENFGNPSSRSHVYGRRASAAVEAARAEVAALIGAKPREIVFTSGATEADCLALAGTLRSSARRHVVTQVTEHSAVLATLDDLVKEGVTSSRIEVDAHGRVAVDALANAITAETALVSIMLASSEIGTVQPIAEIAELASSRGVFVHCDAAQGLGLVPLDVRATPLDLVSISSHKMYGPMGVGALFVRDRHDLTLTPLTRGGGQERGLRGGTLNVPGIVGFGRACTILREEGAEDARRMRGLRDRLQHTLEALPSAHVHGARDERHPGNLSMRFDGVSSERLIMETSRELAFSSGSACASESTAPSPVLRALGLTADEARGGIRLGLGRFTTEDEMTRAGETLVAAVRRIREKTGFSAGRAG